MNKEFIPYEQAFVIRQLGFKEECLGLWQNLKSGKYLVVDDEYDRKYDVPVLGADIGAPLYQQAFRWFREKYQISPSIHCMSEQGNSWRYHIPNEGGETNFSTYEEAELACLCKLIELVKQKP